MADKEEKDVKEILGGITEGLSKLGAGVVDLTIVGVTKAQQKINELQKKKEEKPKKEKPKDTDDKK